MKGRPVEIRCFPARFALSGSVIHAASVLVSLIGVLSGCGSLHSGARTVIEFTEVPEAGQGGAARMEKIAGRVTGARSGQQIVLFARSGTWWVQPYASKPFTAIHKNSTWTTTTHLGTEYAALLVESGYSPPKVADVLPSKGGAVLAIATVAGKPSPLSALPPKIVEFSGYEWDVFQVPREFLNSMHANRASNMWIDEKGWMHLRLRRESDNWTGAEIRLTRSLGYGLYSFVVHELPRLEPATVISMSTWDEFDAGQNHREFSIQLGQWGTTSTKNTRFAIQPYSVPANAFRFRSPSTSVVHSFRWESDRLSFSTEERPGRNVATHVFTSGVPTPGGERVHITVCVLGRPQMPQQNGIEVVFEKFAYLP